MKFKFVAKMHKIGFTHLDFSKTKNAGVSADDPISEAHETVEWQNDDSLNKFRCNFSLEDPIQGIWPNYDVQTGAK